MNKFLVGLLTVVTMGTASAEWHEVLGSKTGNGWDVKDHNIKIIRTIDRDEVKARIVQKDTETCTSGTRQHIEFDGRINESAVEIVETLIAQMPTCNGDDGSWYVNTIYLNSNGGYEIDGYELGYLLRDSQMKTLVDNGQRCMSACADAFLGGIFRSMSRGAQIGFHAPYVMEDGVAVCGPASEQTELKDYLIEMTNKVDGTKIFVETMKRCGGNKFWRLREGRAARLGITT